jgi:hypothetical protein
MRVQLALGGFDPVIMSLDISFESCDPRIYFPQEREDTEYRGTSDAEPYGDEMFFHGLPLDGR